MNTTTKTDFLIWVEELEETDREYSKKSLEIRNRSWELNQIKQDVLQQYAKKYGDLIPGEDYIKTETGVVYKVCNCSAYFSDGRLYISYAMQFNNDTIRFQQEELERNIAKGDWEVSKEASIMTPQSMVIKHIKYIGDNRFFVSNDKFFMLLECNNTWATTRLLKKIEDPEYKFVIKKQRTMYLSYTMEYYIYVCEKDSENKYSKPNRNTKQGRVKLIKVSQNKEDFLEELI